MPFAVKFKDVYEVGIKQACKDAGAYCERVDEQIFEGNILARIYNQIAKADIVVADMTDRSPNVFYETGYAHALNKRVILLTQNVQDIPFDLQQYTHVIYHGESKITSLKAQLEQRLRWWIDNPQDSLSSVDLNLHFLVDGIPIVEKPEVNATLYEFPSANEFNGALNLDIGIHNPTNKLLNPDALVLDLIVPIDWEVRTMNAEPGFRTRTKLPDGRYIYNAKPLAALFPGSWETLSVRFYTGNKNVLNEPTEIVIRLFTELGPKDYPFILIPNKLEKVG